VGAGLLGLGLSLAGPQASGVAAAQTTDPGTATSAPVAKITGASIGRPAKGRPATAVIRPTGNGSSAELVASLQILTEGAGAARRSKIDIVPSAVPRERNFVTASGTTPVDKNYESHVNESGTIIQDRLIPPEGVDPGEYSDILKFSKCTDVVVDNSTILGGKEDAIDAVRGVDYTFQNLTLIPNYNGVTVKGAIDGVDLQNVVFGQHGSSSDLEFGQFDNYWYIGREPTRNITLSNVNAADGRPLVVLLWDAEVPTVLNSNVEIIKIPSFIWFPYFVFRAIQARGLFNICRPPE
jgi:hypothetical protein